ncbi:MFS transporter [Jeotgalibaca sp. MA1X17-3]|nr:MFS transporter [Jeotgalibaca sp. MA1X17-3]UJF15533.1 MFS transporter [Jeotgalibaca sp. MA1X17-3]
MGGISSLLLFFMHTDSVVLYIVINVVGFLGFGVFNLILWAFITDVIDDQEVATGVREDGTIYAIYSFSRK